MVRTTIGGRCFRDTTLCDEARLRLARTGAAVLRVSSDIHILVQSPRGSDESEEGSVEDMDDIARTSSDSRKVPLVVRSYGASDCGRRRPINEDQFLIADLTKTMNVRQTSLEEARAGFGEQRGHLFLVADGMGGHRAGEHASALAVTLIEQFALNTLRWFMPLTAAHADSAVTDFQEAVEQADATIVEAATKSADLHGMGTTLTLAFHYEAELLVIHVGDSRAYLFRDATLRQLTRDHTVVAEMVRRGGSTSPRRVCTDFGTSSPTSSVDLKPECR